MRDNVGLTLSASEEELRERFFVLRTRRDVAELLEIDESRLIYHLHIAPPSKRYTTFEIPKKSHGVRRISAPVTALKIIQRKLNQVLHVVYQPKAPVHSFVRERSIVSNAKVHKRQRNVLNIDLKDFFPSINFGRVRGMFKAVPYQLPANVATVLAQICCFGNELPQGAPTSPIVSNMICAKMDSQLRRLAQKHRCYYTRYADDITFSTSMPTFPPALIEGGPPGQVEIGSELCQIIKDNGFELNPDKIRLRTRQRRQEVTGLTINQFPNVRRQYVRQIRAMLHAWEKHGLEAAEAEFLERYDRKYRSRWKEKPSFEQVVRGKIEFLGMVRGKENEIYRRFRDQFTRLCLQKKYGELEEAEDPQHRGYILEDLLNRLFDLYDFDAFEGFVRNEGAEQIDGAFELEGWYYIVECRWRKKLASIAELDGLLGKVGRSGGQTMGLFLSINGWSQHVPELLKQNPEKVIILMDGKDLRSVLAGVVDLREFIRAKLDQFSLRSEPFFGVEQYLEDRRN